MDQRDTFVANTTFFWRLTVALVLPVGALAVWQSNRASHISVAPIAGGSMAEALYGDHFRVDCNDCGATFHCDADRVPLDELAVCPNCGFRNNQLTERIKRPGERVHVDIGVYVRREPRRWEMVACRAPRGNNLQIVKRIVGRPGELVGIREGEIYIDGRLARKPLWLQRDMAILVHDQAFRPAKSGELSPRWQSEANESGWRHMAERIVFETNSQHASEDLEWLTYRHWRCFANRAPRSEPAPIQDTYGYNQAVSRSESKNRLHVVSDLMLACRAKVSGAGRFAFRTECRGDLLSVEINLRRRSITARQDGVVLQEARLPFNLTNRSHRFEFSTVDQQIILAIDGRILIEAPFRLAKQNTESNSTVLAIGAWGVQVCIDRLRVYRDIFYLEPHGVRRVWKSPRRLGDNEFFLLGDNPPISEDSRTWGGLGVKRKQLTGMILRRRVGRSRQHSVEP